MNLFRDRSGSRGRRRSRERQYSPYRRRIDRRSRDRRSGSRDNKKVEDQDKFKGSLSEGLFVQKAQSSDEEIDM